LSEHYVTVISTQIYLLFQKWSTIYARHGQHSRQILYFWTVFTKLWPRSSQIYSETDRHTGRRNAIYKTRKSKSLFREVTAYY